jgi:hypothetical protein
MPKIALGRAVGVLEPLQYVIDKIAKKHPHYKFEADFNDMTVIRKSDDTKEHWVNQVQVFDDVDPIGSVSYGRYEGKENKNGEKPEAFGIASRYVQKKRGTRDTVITVDPAAAVRHALKVFGKPSPVHIAAELANSVHSCIVSREYEWRYAMRELCSFNTEEMTIMFVEHKMFGREITLPKSLHFNEEKKPQYDTYMAGRQVMKAIADDRSRGIAPKGFAVQYLKDESIRVVDIGAFKSLSRSKQDAADVSTYMTRWPSFNHMPEYLQNKIAVLKIAQVNEAVFNVGIRTAGSETEQHQFFILDEASLEEYPDANATL